MAKLKLTHKGTERILDMGCIKIREGQEMRELTGWTPRQWESALFESDAEACGYAWYWACQRSGDNPTWLHVLDDFNLIEFTLDVVQEAEPPKAAKAGKASDPTGSVTQPDTIPTKSTSGNPGSSSISDLPESNSTN